MIDRIGSLKSLGLAAALFIGVSAGAANAATLLTNGSFEDPTASNPFSTIPSVASLPGWDIELGSIDLIGNYWQHADGLQSIDMNGAPGNSPATISQTINNLINGATYYLSFYLAGNPDGAPTVKKLTAMLDNGIFGSTGTSLFGATFDTTGKTKLSMGWQQFYQTFTYTGITGGSLKLSFVGDGDGTPYGPALDDVSLGAVPVPAALPLFGTALGAMALLRFRRKRGAASFTA